MHKLLLDLLRMIPPYNLLPELLQHVIVMAIILVGFIGFVSVTALILIWMERKISARMQNRVGPMLAVPWGNTNRNMWLGGLLQTGADALKLLFKEDIIPTRVDTFVFKLAPYTVITATMLGLIVVPFAQDFVVSNMDVGLLYLMAVSSLTVLSIMMAGWASNNKYSLIGGLRSVAQMISYEVPMIIALLGPVILAGSLNLTTIVNAPNTYFGPFGILLWFGVNIIGFVVYVICGTAETNRPPFDLVEGESELVAGFSTEYSGMRFAMFYLGEFVNMFIISSIATCVFLGGWRIGFGVDELMRANLPAALVTIISLIIFTIKAYLMVLVFMWIRWTFPRLRADHLMNFGWKVLLPWSFVNLVVATGVTWLNVIVLHGGPS